MKNFKLAVTGVLIFTILLSSKLVNPAENRLLVSIKKSDNTTEANQFDFLGFIKSVYNAYNKIKNFFDPDPDLGDLIIQAKNEIIEEINLVRAEEQIGNVNALIEEYAIYLNNPPTTQTLEAWIRDAINVTNQFEIIIQNKSPRIAYLSAKAYNMLIPIMALIMQREGIQAQDIKPLFEDAINTNKVLLGDYCWNETPNAPLYHDVLYGSGDYIGKLLKCWDTNVIDWIEYVNVYNIVWQANEELRRQTIDHYEDIWFYIHNEAGFSNNPISPDDNNFLCAHPWPFRMFNKVEAKPLLENNTDFLWRLEFQNAFQVKIIHWSGKYLTVRPSGEVKLTSSPIHDDTVWEFSDVNYPDRPSIKPIKDTNSALSAQPDTCYISPIGYTPGTGHRWVIQYARTEKSNIGYSAFPCPGDYDGDGKEDLSLMLVDGRWLIDYADNGFGAWDVAISEPSRLHRFSQPAPGDYDGDGKTDLCVMENTSGNWYIDYASDGFNGWEFEQKKANFSDAYYYCPVPGDYDGDGKTDIAMCKAYGGWNIDYSSDDFSNWNTYPHGWQTYYPKGDFYPIPADYDGDGKTDVSIKTDDRQWLIDFASDDFKWTNEWDASFFIAMVSSGHGMPAVGNYTWSEPDDELGIFRTDQREWYTWDYLAGSPATVLPGLSLSLQYDITKRAYPVPADYDGDGMTDISIVLEDGTWHIEYSGNNYQSNHWDWSSNMLVITDVQESEKQSPMTVRDFRLRNFPNPFTGHTTIQFVLPEPARISVKIYNLLGREIATLVQKQKPQGLSTITWNGTDCNGRPVPSGVYFCRLIVQAQLKTLKILVLR